MTTITDANFDAMITKNRIVLVDFWAEWCGPCRALTPVIEALAQEYEGKVLVGKVNVDENAELPEKFGIMNIPTLLFFKDGQLIEKKVGALPKPAIIEELEKLLA